VHRIEGGEGGGRVPEFGSAGEGGEKRAKPGAGGGGGKNEGGFGGEGKRESFAFMWGRKGKGVISVFWGGGGGHCSSAEGEERLFYSRRVAVFARRREVRALVGRGSLRLGGGGKSAI